MSQEEKTVKDFGGIKLCTGLHTTTPMFRWIVELNNGMIIFEDELPGMKGSWLRLKDVINRSDGSLTIVKMFFQIPDQKFEMPENMSGYYFVKKMEKDVTKNTEIKSYLMGYRSNSGPIFVLCWSGHFGLKIYEIDEKQAGFGLIRHKPECLSF